MSLRLAAGGRTPPCAPFVAAAAVAAAAVAVAVAVDASSLYIHLL